MKIKKVYISEDPHFIPDIPVIYKLLIDKDTKNFRGVYIPENFHVNISSIKEKSIIDFQKDVPSQRNQKITPNDKVYRFRKNFKENDILTIKLTNKGDKELRQEVDIILFFEE